jgi:hypothetical protein
MKTSGLRKDHGMKDKMLWFYKGAAFSFLFFFPFLSLAQTDKAANIEQQVRKKMGFDSKTLTSFIVDGKISRYGRDGQKRGEFPIRLSKKNPNLIRVDTANEAGSIVYGMDSTKHWKLGSGKVTPGDRQELHDWFRLWPDWFLASRNAANSFAWTGVQTISAIPLDPQTDPILLNPAIDLAKLEIEDAINSGADTAVMDPVERRIVTFGIDPSTNLITMASWIEPYVAGEDLNDPNTKRVLVQVYFLDYKQTQGFWWPSRLVHLYGYAVDFVIQLDNISFNPAVDNTTFAAPAQQAE